ncbi:MAG: 16S rRNA (adenine1518-N6/adenine1519-N6)-dimethyltransferase [Hyphomicrobiaceae bacterium]|jgi:16S rRNA (adenine1518-N6/adenine1519-N6)-dimethyltransferase
MSPLAFDGLPALREVIESHGLSPKKNLGQNFILDLNLTTKIAHLAGQIKDRTVVEIGPGPGGLTRALLQGGARKVIAIERDERCLAALDDVSRHWPDRLTVHAADALNVNWPDIIQLSSVEPDEKLLIIANLPYSIATKLLIGWLETEPWPPWFDGMALMFQREVAERIVAEPSTKPYGRLAVISQWRCACDISLTLGPEAFTPPPKVASAVVRFTPRQSPAPACDVRALGQVSRVIFGQRRKMLRATLKTLFRDPETILEGLGIEPTARAETLTVSDIARLAIAMEQSK